MIDLTPALIGLGTILTASTLVWMISVRLEDASIADICWGLGFVLLAWLYCLLSPTLTPRSWLVAVLITLWGARLSLHIVRRNHGKEEDPRYRAMRASHGRAFWWRSLFTVFWLQGAILWFVALPLLVAVRASSPAALTAVDGLGVLLFAIGFGFEVVGDYQLERFRAEPSNRGNVLDRGLWRYTRHPNYFGDATLWWGLYAIAATTPSGWLTVLSPALMTFLLMRVSGVTLLEDWPESLEARLSRVHHPHSGVLPLVSARSAVIDCGAPPTECQFRGTLRRQRGRSGRRSADRRAAPLNRSTSNRRPQARARHRPCARSMCPQWCR